MNSENGENEITNIRPMTTPGKLNQKTPGKIQQTPGKIQQKTPSKVGAFALRPSSAATASTTPSSTRDAAIQAKLLSTAERIQKVANLKDKWAKEKEKKVKSHRERRSNELKRQQEIMLSAYEHRKLAMEKKKEIEEKKKAIEKELLTSSLETAAQLSRDLAEKIKERRRQSIALNHEIFSRAQQKVQELSAQKKMEQDSIYEGKKEDFNALREAKKLASLKRRESMAMRTEAARKAKEIDQDIKIDEKQQEKSLLDFRYSAWTCEKEYKSNEAAKRRESMAGRLDVWRQHKEFEENKRNAEHEDSLSDLNKRREDWLEIQLKKKEIAQQERNSIRKNLDQWREETKLMNLTEKEEAEAASYEFQLKTQEREDVLNYKKKLEEERRQSLAFRLEAARRDKDWERGQATLLAIATEESRHLDQEDRACVEKHKNDEEESRRASLQYRNLVGMQELIRLADIKKQEHTEAVEDFEIQHDDWLDVQSHKQSLKDQQRKSLAMRLVHSRKRKEEALLAHKDLLDKMHEELDRKRNDWIDVKTSLNEEKQRRRNSVSLRLDSWKAQRMVAEMEASKTRMQDQEDFAVKEQEAEDLRAAKEAMKDKEKLDRILGNMVF